MVVRLRIYRFALALGALGLALSACSALAAPSGTPAPDGTALAQATGEVEGLNSDQILQNFGQATATSVAPRAMSQAEAQAQLPFRYTLPAWAPPGFNLQDEVEVVLPGQAGDSGAYASVIITWLDANESALRLQVASRSADQPRLGGAGSSQEVSVNGEPAVLVQSGSASLGQARLTLAWQRGGLSYSLAVDAGAVSADDLLHMAESIPEG